MTFFERIFRNIFTLFKPNRNQHLDSDSEAISMHSFTPVLPQTPLTPPPPSIPTTSNHDTSIRDAPMIADETLPILETTLDIHIVDRDEALTQSKMDAEYRDSDTLQPLYSPIVRRPVEDIIEDNPDRQSLHSDTSTALPPYTEDERNPHYIFTSNPRAVGNVTNVDWLVNVDRRPGQPGPVIATCTQDDSSPHFYNQRRNAWHPRRQPAPPKTAWHPSGNQNIDRLPRLYT